MGISTSHEPWPTLEAFSWKLFHQISQWTEVDHTMSFSDGLLQDWIPLYQKISSYIIYLVSRIFPLNIIMLISVSISMGWAIGATCCHFQLMEILTYVDWKNIMTVWRFKSDETRIRRKISIINHSELVLVPSQLSSLWHCWPFGHDLILQRSELC